MIYHRRHVESNLRRLAQRFPVVALAGARQTGKSTLLGHLFGDGAEVVVFDPVTDVGGAREDPELFLQLHRPPLILDEIQHAPELLPAIKRRVDAQPGQKGQYLMTGSQQFAVLRGVQESLAGRALMLDLPPMSRAELADELADDRSAGLVAALYADDPPRDAWTLLARLQAAGTPSVPRGNLFERLYRGGFPGLLDFDTADIPAWFDSYLRTYVERDVRTLRDVERPHDFTRLLRLMAALTAQEVNASQLGRDIGVNPKTAGAWLDILEASFQAVRLPAYSGNTVKRISGRPKLHLADTGFACMLQAVSSPRALAAHPALGALFESYAVTEILKQSRALVTPPRAWHWRTAAGAEVDLLLERDGRLVPIEVKLSGRPSRRDLSGLRAFAATYPDGGVGPRIIIHGGSELALVDEETVAVPIEWV